MKIIDLFFLTGCVGVMWFIMASEFYRNEKWDFARLLRLILIFVFAFGYTIMAECLKCLIF
jgi:hypothetical protein